MAASDGREADVRYRPRWRRWIGGQLGAGEIGCAESHRRALQRLVDSGARFGVILEDDAELAPDFRAAVEHLVSRTAGWDLVRLEQRKPDALARTGLRLPAGRTLVVPRNTTFGSTAMLYSARGRPVGPPVAGAGIHAPARRPSRIAGGAGLPFPPAQPARGERAVRAVSHRAAGWHMRSPAIVRQPGRPAAPLQSGPSAGQLDRSPADGNGRRAPGLDPVSEFLAFEPICSDNETNMAGAWREVGGLGAGRAAGGVG